MLTHTLQLETCVKSLAGVAQESAGGFIALYRYIGRDIFSKKNTPSVGLHQTQKSKSTGKTSEGGSRKKQKKEVSDENPSASKKGKKE